MKLSILLLTFLLSINVVAQDSGTYESKPVTTLSGFVDAFYMYDFNQPGTNYRQGFFYNHNRHNEFNVNLALMKVNVEHAKYRANFAFHAGTYGNDNYSEEPGLLKNIFEANVGISLNERNNLWLDAGVFASHIGFESAISTDNWTLTRSFIAESSPYFLSGAKLTYNPNDKWELVALMCNGWQRIQRLEGNSLPSYGTQVNYSPNERITLNWSTFIGTDEPDSTRRMRYFNDFFGQFQLSEKFSLIAGIDYGVQQRAKSSDSYDAWFTPIIIGQLTINKSWKTAVRAEYFQDNAEIIIPTETGNEFNITGLSWNWDYWPTSNVACRLEARWLNSKDRIFATNDDSFSNNNFTIGSSIAIQFSEMLK
ncbi:porin [Marivirga sp. S37H4]|uniref:Porin n=1 Tax=Marivirga aurantiaca TaxID=2802615 RepID=A0A935C9R9_9BACT|nr:porin [Marivirga aurantiaca]MBK6265767.1 porin [Marivirga aurantiaca]